MPFWFAAYGGLTTAWLATLGVAAGWNDGDHRWTVGLLLAGAFTLFLSIRTFWHGRALIRDRVPDERPRLFELMFGLAVGVGCLFVGSAAFLQGLDVGGLRLGLGLLVAPIVLVIGVMFIAGSIVSMMSPAGSSSRAGGPTHPAPRP